MRREGFWVLIQQAADRHDDVDARVDALIAELSDRPPEDITAFADHLASVLRALDTPAHAAAAEADGDAFLYIRCAVVAAGHDAWEQIRRRPAAIAAFADQDAEPLLNAAEGAYYAVTGMAWEHETPVSYETGANHQAWGTAAPADAPDGAPPPQPKWLSVVVASAIQPAPRPVYEHTVDALVDALDSDPGWQQWWQASGIPRLTAHLFFGGPDHGPTAGRAGLAADIRLGRRLVDASFETSEQPFATTDHAALRHRAVTDLTSMLDSVRQALDLPDPPRLPRLPDVPDDLPDAYRSDFDDIDGVVAAINELARHHDYVTPQLIDRYLKERGADQPDAPE